MPRYGLRLTVFGGSQAFMGAVAGAFEKPLVEVSGGAPVRVLHVHSGNMFGGVEWFLRTLARYADRSPSMTSEFALCFDAKLAGDLRSLGATVHILGAARISSPRRVDAVRRALARVLAAGRYDVVVCHSAWPHAMFAPIVREHGAPLIQFMHDVPNARGWVDHLANRTPPDLVLCNTHFMETAGPWWFRDVPRQMLRYPVPLGGPVARSARASVRASLGTREGDVVILHASRMQEWKGHRVLVKALDGLRDNPRWTCWIAGGGQRPNEASYVRALHDEVEALGLTERIRFLGHRDDVPAVMAASDIYCQPNIAPEPFGVSFLEALAAGLPVVTTAMGGPLEFIDGTCGALVQGDHRAVTAALATLVDDGEKRATLSKGGPPRARELCDVDTRMHGLADAFSNFRSGEPSVPAPSLAPRRRSRNAVLSAVIGVLRGASPRHGTLVELGCGRGDGARVLAGLCREYLGADFVASTSFPASPTVGFRKVDLDSAPYPFDDASADAVVAIETIGRLENPFALVREMTRIVRPGGWIVVTTANQLSVTSKVVLVTRNQFPGFEARADHDPPPITALIEGDLVRIANLSGLVDVDVRYADRGRVPLTTREWPANLGPRGRWFSDHVILVARRPWTPDPS